MWIRIKSDATYFLMLTNNIDFSSLKLIYLRKLLKYKILKQYDSNIKQSNSEQSLDLDSAKLLVFDFLNTNILNRKMYKHTSFKNYLGSLNNIIFFILFMIQYILDVKYKLHNFSVPGRNAQQSIYRKGMSFCNFTVTNTLL